MPTRRDLLKTNATIAGAVLLPKAVVATSVPNFHFIHSDTLNSWPIADPVQWSLEHAHDPILARAAEGLGKLSSSDGDRIIRRVVRRCSLNLIELHPGMVVVDHWGSNRADLRPFFKLHGLARPEIEVVLRDRKKETVATLTGDSFLYGLSLVSDFDIELFKKKWERRFVNESDDLEAAPNTSSGFAWTGLPDGFIPWMALKSAWRRSGPGVCQNCDGETILTNFGFRQVGQFNRASCFDYVCGTCRRSFRNETVDVKEWIVANLDAEVWPEAEMVRGRRVAHTTKAHT